jgi:hypothetical protein
VQEVVGFVDDHGGVGPVVGWALGTAGGVGPDPGQDEGSEQAGGVLAELTFG